MYTCPACGATTIGLVRKWLSRPALPAQCASCGAFSTAHANSSGVGLVAGCVLSTLSGFAAVALHAAWPFVLGVLLSVIFYAWHWHGVRLELVLPADVTAAKRRGTAGALAVLLATLFN